jgi:putative hydrolase of the HAD superfamily
MPIRAVLFDAGNTLVWLDHAFLVELLAEHGVIATERDLLEAEQEAKRALDELVRSGRVGGDAARGRAYFAEVFRRLGVSDEQFPPLAQRLWARHAERNLWSSVRERTAETLGELRDRGFRLAVISNADGRVEALLAATGLGEFFDFVIDSHLVGMEKPDPRIFQLGLERMGVEPHEAVYVGDLYEVDVVGARAAGMRPILIDPLDRFAELDCERIVALPELTSRLAETA